MAPSLSGGKWAIMRERVLKRSLTVTQRHENVSGNSETETGDGKCLPNVDPPLGRALGFQQQMLS